MLVVWEAFRKPLLPLSSFHVAFVKRSLVVSLLKSALSRCARFVRLALERQLVRLKNEGCPTGLSSFVVSDLTMNLFKPCKQTILEETKLNRIDVPLLSWVLE